jgi:hypothetical protein
MWKTGERDFRTADLVNILFIFLCENLVPKKFKIVPKFQINCYESTVRELVLALSKRYAGQKTRLYLLTAYLLMEIFQMLLYENLVPNEY